MSQFLMVMDVQDWDSIQIEKDVLAGVGCEILPLEFPTEDELMAALRKADALLPRYLDIRERHIQAMERCRIISRSGIGVDIVDVEAATRRGIWVTNVPQYCEEEVADHALSLILALARKVFQYQDSVARGEWSWRVGRPVMRMSQAVFGLVGFGRIGRMIWQRMKGFGGTGLVYDPYARPEDVAGAGASLVDLDTLLTSADIIQIQCPLTPETRHLIDAAALKKMKPTAMLVNTARGPIVCEEDLVEALQNGWIAAAGLDDLELEPAKRPDWDPATNPLIQLPKVIVTPHTAWYSEQAAETVKRVSASEIARVLSGQRPLYPVNQPQGL